MAMHFYPGQRLSYSGALCTIRYIGPVKGTKGEWLGVEWDDTSKGKHSGVHAGVKYFACLSREPTAGSFVRPTRESDQSLGLLEALRQKYAPEPEDLNSDGSLSSETIEISGKVVEEIGFEKIRRQLATLQELRIILLDGSCLAGLGSRPWSGDYEDWLLQVQKTQEVCPRVTELDLSRNLLESWLDIAGICNALERLKSLKLNCNRFRDLSMLGLEKTELHSAFGSVTELHLDDTLLAWEEITSLTTLFPSLTILSLSANNITYIFSSIAVSTLTQLVFNHNLFTSLSSLSALSSLPNLQTLSLAFNQLCAIHTPNEPPPIFESLLTLDLSSNAIPSLEFIAHLPTSFPSITSLRISHNPFSLNLSLDEAFIHTVARIRTLTTLNYSTITPAERTNAELYYLSNIGKQLSSTSEAEEATILKAHHPRYTDLCTLHGGGPVITRTTPTNSSTEYSPNSLNSRLIDFTFYLPAVERQKAKLLPASTRLPLVALAKQPTPFIPSTHPAMITIPSSDSNEEEKESTTTTHHSLIPRTFTPYRVKSLAGALFNLPPMHLRLMWETGEWDPIGRVQRSNNDIDEENDDRWSVDSLSSSSEGEGEGEDEDANGSNDDNDDDGATLPSSRPKPHPDLKHKHKHAKKKDSKGRFIAREVELVDGTRQVGFWIEEKVATVRLEVRERTW